MATEENLHQPNVEREFHEEVGTIARQLRQCLRRIAAKQSMHEAASNRKPPVSEAPAFQHKLMKERAINSYLQRKIFHEKWASEYLMWKLTALRVNIYV